jgi:hypothetical protein
MDKGFIFVSLGLTDRWFYRNSLTSSESIPEFLAANLHQMDTTIIYFVVGHTGSAV